MESSSAKFNSTLKSENASYDFTLIKKDGEITFKIEDLKVFPAKLFQLKTQFKDLKQLDENFSIFEKVERFINTLKRAIQGEKYSISYNEEENAVIFEIKNDIFETGVAKIKIPEQEPDMKAQLDSMTKIVSELRKEMQDIKIKKTEKDEAALNSFKYSSFLKDDEKKQISKWIHPDKVLRFNMLFSTDKDGDRSSKFHYFCDGVFPTVTVILDTSGRRFGGYSTQNWAQSTVGSSYSRAPESFIFNLSKNQKYDLVDQLNVNAVYKYNSYGPTFGGGHDFYINDSCKSNSSECSQSSYNTGNTDILDGAGSFVVSTYEVYQVIFD